MKWRIGNPLTVVFLIAAATSSAWGQHNVPSNQQDGTSDCGPAAAASCLKWFQQNGWPNLTAGNGGSGLKDYENQLENDAKTDENGTWAHKLADAMNKLVNGGPYKGQLKAKLPKGSDNAYTGFGYLDSEFSHNEDILLLFTCKNQDGSEYDHYVTVRNVTGTGATRSVEYMDPADGSTKTATAQVGPDGKLHINHDGDCRISGILTMSPSNTTTTTTQPVDPGNPSAGTKITYTVYYPPFRPTKDEHIWVTDCTKANYTVTGLPAGWQWDVKQQGDKCYLSFWKDGSTEDIPNGGAVTVTYTGPRKVRDCREVITPTTDGTANVTDGPQPPGDGHTVSAVTPQDPLDPPVETALALLNVTPMSIGALMTWSAVPGTNFLQYEVYDLNSGELVAETNDTQLPLMSLEPDVVHQFAVSARDEDVQLSVDGDAVMVYLDAAGARELLPGPPQDLRYVPALYSGDAPVEWRLRLPGAAAPGRLYVVTLAGAPAVPLPPNLVAHEHYYHLFSDVPLDPGPIEVSLHYDTADVQCSESGVRLLALNGGQWQDVTTGVDPNSNLVSGALPALTTLMIADSPTPIPAASASGLLVLAVLLAISAIAVLRQANKRNAA